MTETLRLQIEASLASQGLRRTRQGVVIVRAAFGTREHFIGDEILEMARAIDRTISRATVYLHLGPAGEDRPCFAKVDLGREQTYYDPNFLDKPEHNHLICVDCDRVVEFESEHIAVLEDCITRRLGFKPTSKSIRIQANCEELARTGHCQYLKTAEANR